MAARCAARGGPRAPPAPRAGPPPPLRGLDWTRYHQQVLFVDRSDTIRARCAQGLFERCCDYAGHSRVLVAHACGVGVAAPGSRPPLDATAALMGVAHAWRLRPSLFTAPRQVFEEEDIDRFDVIVALDKGIEAEVLKRLSGYRPAEPGSYTGRVCCLADALHYVDEPELLGIGSALLDRRLRDALRPRLAALRGGAGAGGGDCAAAAMMGRLSLGAPLAAWEDGLLAMAVSAAGLVQFLIDAYPTDLPDWDELGLPPG